MKISGQMATDVANYSSYDNLRKICSLVDGQKNAARKILWTVLEKNINQEVKVSRLDSTFQEFTEYLHGSATNVICNMAQDFPGTNNVPLLARSGNFGNRFIQEASAPRYIYTYKHKNADALFNKLDSNILEHQYFEGSKIEPKFLVPNLPILLLNGSEGVSSGFAQKILPRNPEKIKQYIKDYLTGSLRPSEKNSLEPFYSGFNGVIEQGLSSKQWLIKGSFKQLSQTKLEITEVPIGYDLKSYIDVLDSLEDKGIIKSYQDKSENDIFNFVVSVDSKFFSSFSTEQILDKLKLISRVSENFTCIDELNKIQQYTSVEQILEHYIKVKLEYTKKRKEFLENSLDFEIRKSFSIYSFIKEITENKITISKRTKENIQEQLKEFSAIIKIDDSYDYLLRLPIYSLTEEKMQDLLEKIKKQKLELETLQKTKETELWLIDLE